MVLADVHVAQPITKSRTGVTRSFSSMFMWYVSRWIMTLSAPMSSARASASRAVLTTFVS